MSGEINGPTRDQDGGISQHKSKKEKIHPVHIEEHEKAHEQNDGDWEESGINHHTTV